MVQSRREKSQFEVSFLTDLFRELENACFETVLQNVFVLHTLNTYYLFR